MREIAQLEQDQGRALLLGEVGQVVDELAQLDPLLHLLDHAHAGDQVFLERQRGGPASADHREAPVARDRVEPRLDVDRAVVLGQRAVGRGKGLLHGVLGLLVGAEDLAAEGEDGRPVALEQHLEGRLAAPAHERGQAAVSGEGQHAPGTGQRPASPAGIGVEAIRRGS